MFDGIAIKPHTFDLHRTDIVISLDGGQPDGNSLCFGNDDKMVYHPYCDDFGPLNMSSTIHFVKLMNEKIAECAKQNISTLVYVIENGRRPSNRCSIFDYGTSPGRIYRIRHGTSPVTAVHVSMSVTRDRSHGCIRDVRDYGYVIASWCEYNPHARIRKRIFSSLCVESSVLSWHCWPVLGQRKSTVFTFHHTFNHNARWSIGRVTDRSRLSPPESCPARRARIINKIDWGRF
jgi:hypothetical protein